MRLLLDTHVLLALIEPSIGAAHSKLLLRLNNVEAEVFFSVASLWEIAIKCEIGKLKLGCEPATLPDLIRDIGGAILPISEHHVLAVVKPEPKTRDPFDRLLLAQCQVEGLKLVTVDRVLVKHPLADNLD